MLPRDTHPDAHQLQLRLYRAMSPARRVALAAQCSADIRSIACSGIRQRYPEYSDADVFRELNALLFGPVARCPTRGGVQRMLLDPVPFLSRLVDALNVAGVPFMLAGSAASSMHGVPRATRDLDFVIDPSAAELARLLERFAEEEFYADPSLATSELRRRGQFNVIDSASAWKADLIYRKDRPFSRAEFERRALAVLLDISLFVATAEDTVLAKLEWAKLGASERQLDDVRGIVEVQADGLDRAYIESWLDALEVRELWEQKILR